MAGHGKKKKRHDDHGEHVDERWLLTYSDLITLLMALFMVLFSISSVNKSKFESLQRALQEAFSGKVLPGGHGIANQGGSNNIKNPSVSPPLSSLQPYMGGKPQESSKTAAASAAAAQQEDKSFQQLKRRIDAVARQKGISGKVQTEITKDGLLIRIMTDNLFFDSGQATPRPPAMSLMVDLAKLLNGEASHKIVVEGHTDNEPIHSAVFPTNWELSAARAASIVRTFADDGVAPARMTAAGRAYMQPVAPNDTAAGRSLNRRVEVLLPRQVPISSSNATFPTG